MNAQMATQTKAPRPALAPRSPALVSLPHGRPVMVAACHHLSQEPTTTLAGHGDMGHWGRPCHAAQGSLAV